ncbi:hypothetical protein ACQPZ8_37445 [Actinomadura nitritigenes]|uniref:hypothetical protein n=1 Tax=Actinomadura nitritigenes TaxID=134602 RepID=UPI003D900AAF
MDGKTADALTIEASVVMELIAQTPLCQDCPSEHMIHVGRDEAGDLDLNVVVAHDATCPRIRGCI